MSRARSARRTRLRKMSRAQTWSSAHVMPGSTRRTRCAMRAYEAPTSQGLATHRVLSVRCMNLRCSRAVLTWQNVSAMRDIHRTAILLYFVLPAQLAATSWVLTMSIAHHATPQHRRRSARPRHSRMTACARLVFSIPRPWQVPAKPVR